MGRGLVQLFAQAGHRVHCFDAAPGAAPKAVDFALGMIGRGVEKGRLSAEAFEAVLTDDAAQADLFFVQPWGIDATGMATALGLDATRVVAVDPMVPMAMRRTLMLTAITSAAARDSAWGLLAADGVPVTVINDSPGFIAQRVLATIVNIAAQIAQRGIASVADIEDAVQPGLGHPHGPLAWGDRIGGARILQILRTMQAETGDPRYRPSPWLVRRVALDVSLLTAEAARA